MGNAVRFVVATSLLGIACGESQCDSSDPVRSVDSPTPFSWDCSEDVPQLTPSAIAVPAEFDGLVDVSPASLTLTIQGRDELDPVVGSILVGGSLDYPLLRQVTALRRDGNLVILETEPAQLTDAFTELCIQLTPSALPDAIRIELIEFDRSLDFEASLGDNASLGGRIDVYGALYLGILISRRSPNKFEFGGNLDVGFVVEPELIAGPALSLEEDCNLLPEITLARVFVPIPPLPIGIPVELELETEGALECTVAAGFTLTTELEFAAGGDFSFAVANGRLQHAFHLEREFSMAPLSLSLAAHGECQLSIGPSLDLEILGVAEAGIGFGSVANIVRDRDFAQNLCTWEAQAGLGLWVEAGSDILDTIDAQAMIWTSEPIWQKDGEQACSGCITDSQQCVDEDPCTVGQCIDGACVQFPVANGEPCGSSLECFFGVCVAGPTIDASSCPMNQSEASQDPHVIFEVVGQWAGDISEPASPGLYVGLDTSISSGAKVQIPLSWLVDDAGNLTPSHIEDALQLAECYGRKAVVDIVPAYPNYQVKGDLPDSATPLTWLDIGGGPVPTLSYLLTDEEISLTHVPLLWNAEFLALYTDALHRVGAAYDGDPRIARVEIGVCNWGETFCDLRLHRSADLQAEAAAEWQAAGWTQQRWLDAIEIILSAGTSAFSTTQTALQITDVGVALVDPLGLDPNLGPLRLLTQAVVDRAKGAGIDVLQYDGLRPEPQYGTDRVMFEVIAANAEDFAVSLEAHGPSGASYPHEGFDCDEPWAPTCFNQVFLSEMLAWGQKYAATTVILWPADLLAGATGDDGGVILDFLKGNSLPNTACTPTACTLSCLQDGGGLHVQLAHSGDTRFERGFTSRVLPGQTIEFVSVGSNCIGNWTPTSTPSTTWAIPASGSLQLDLDARTHRFNLWAWVSTATGAAKAVWLDLQRWNVTGDCYVKSEDTGQVICAGVPESECVTATPCE